MVQVSAFSDLSQWIRGEGLEIVLWVTGSILVARFIAWVGTWTTDRIDHLDSETDSLVRSENAKRRHALTQVLTWRSS